MANSGTLTSHQSSWIENLESSWMCTVGSLVYHECGNLLIEYVYQVWRLYNFNLNIWTKGAIHALLHRRANFVQFFISSGNGPVKMYRNKEGMEAPKRTTPYSTMATSQWFDISKWTGIPLTIMFATCVQICSNSQSASVCLSTASYTQKPLM